VVWGDNTDPTTANIEWTSWKYFESPTEARNNGGWNQLELLSADSFVSNVIDSGGLREKKIIITYNAESGSGSIYYRTSNTPFVQEDVLPNWIAYSSPVNVEFRFYQVRVDA